MKKKLISLILLECVLVNSIHLEWAWAGEYFPSAVGRSLSQRPGPSSLRPKPSLQRRDTLEAIAGASARDGGELSWKPLTKSPYFHSSYALLGRGLTTEILGEKIEIVSGELVVDKKGYLATHRQPPGSPYRLFAQLLNQNEQPYQRTRELFASLARHHNFRFVRGMKTLIRRENEGRVLIHAALADPRNAPPKEIFWGFWVTLLRSSVIRHDPNLVGPHAIGFTAQAFGLLGEMGRLLLLRKEEREQIVDYLLSLAQTGEISVDADFLRRYMETVEEIEESFTRNFVDLSRGTRQIYTDFALSLAIPPIVRLLNPKEWPEEAFSDLVLSQEFRIHLSTELKRLRRAEEFQRVVRTIDGEGDPRIPETAVIGDVKMDARFLNLVLKRAVERGADKIIFLGDIFGKSRGRSPGGGSPLAVYDTLRKFEKVFKGRGVYLFGPDDIFFLFNMMGYPGIDNVWFNNYGGKEFLEDRNKEIRSYNEEARRQKGEEAELLPEIDLNNFREDPRLQEVAEWLRNRFYVYHLDEFGVLHVNGGLPEKRERGFSFAEWDRIEELIRTSTTFKTAAFSRIMDANDSPVFASDWKENSQKLNLEEFLQTARVDGEGGHEVIAVMTGAPSFNIDNMSFGNDFDDATNVKEKARVGLRFIGRSGVVVDRFKEGKWETTVEDPPESFLGKVRKNARRRVDIVAEDLEKQDKTILALLKRHDISEESEALRFVKRVKRDVASGAILGEEVKGRLKAIAKEVLYGETSLPDREELHEVLGIEIFLGNILYHTGTKEAILLVGKEGLGSSYITWRLVGATDPKTGRQLYPNWRLMSHNATRLFAIGKTIFGGTKPLHEIPEKWRRLYYLNKEREVVQTDILPQEEIVEITKVIFITDEPIAREARTRLRDLLSPNRSAFHEYKVRAILGIEEALRKAPTRALRAALWEIPIEKFHVGVTRGIRGARLPKIAAIIDEDVGQRRWGPRWAAWLQAHFPRGSGVLQVMKEWRRESEFPPIEPEESKRARKKEIEPPDKASDGGRMWAFDVDGAWGEFLKRIGRLRPSEKEALIRELYREFLDKPDRLTRENLGALEARNDEILRRMRESRDPKVQRIYQGLEDYFIRQVEIYGETKIRPIAEKMDRWNLIPVNIYLEMGRLGIFSTQFPQRYGGMGLSTWASERVNIVISKVSSGATLGALNVLGSLYPYMFEHATEAQKKRYLRPVSLGEAFGAFGLTESEAGSDQGGIKSEARKGLVNGGKRFITVGGAGILPSDFKEIIATEQPEPRSSLYEKYVKRFGQEEYGEFREQVIKNHALYVPIPHYIFAAVRTRPKDENQPKKWISGLILTLKEAGVEPIPDGNVLILSRGRGVPTQKITAKSEEVMGQRGSGTTDLSFEDVPVSLEEDLIGDAENGVDQFSKTLSESGRLTISGHGIGILLDVADRLEQAIQDRIEKVGEEDIGVVAAQALLKEIQHQADLTSAMLERAARKKDRGESIAVEAAVAKIVTSEASRFYSGEAIRHFFNLADSVGEARASMRYRDAKLLEIGEGTSEIQRNVIKSALLKEKLLEGKGTRYANEEVRLIHRMREGKDPLAESLRRLIDLRNQIVGIYQRHRDYVIGNISGRSEEEKIESISLKEIAFAGLANTEIFLQQALTAYEAYQQAAKEEKGRWQAIFRQILLESLPQIESGFPVLPLQEQRPLQELFAQLTGSIPARDNSSRDGDEKKPPTLSPEILQLWQEASEGKPPLSETDPFNRVFLPFLREGIRNLPLDGKAVIVDLGSHQTWLPLAEKLQGRSILYIDLAASHNRQIGHHLPIQGDARAIPLPSESVDLLVSRFVLEYLLDYPELFGREIHRVLKEKGKVILILHHPQSDIIRGLKDYELEIKTIKFYKAFLNTLSIESSEGEKTFKRLLHEIPPPIDLMTGAVSQMLSDFRDLLGERATVQEFKRTYPDLEGLMELFLDAQERSLFPLNLLAESKTIFPSLEEAVRFFREQGFEVTRHEEIIPPGEERPLAYGLVLSKDPAFEARDGGKKAETTATVAQDGGRRQWEPFLGFPGLRLLEQSP